MQQFLKEIRPLLYGRPVMYFDVGAYKGAVFTEVAETDWGSFLEAHLFEPNPDSFPALQRAASAAQVASIVKQVHCHSLAVSSEKTALRFRSESTRTRVVGASDVLDASKSDEYFEGNALTLDEIAACWGVKHISILKIDVEGHEGEVIKGAQNLLEAQAVDLIYVEAGMDPANQQQYYYRLLEDKLLPLKYRLFKIFEQKNEWLTDSPFLRRVNLAFMSEKFATQTPFRLSKKLFDLQKKNSETESALASATEKITATTSELSTLRATLKTRLSEYEEGRSELLKKLSDSEKQGRRRAAEVEANLAASEKSLAERTLECASREKNLAEKEAECLRLQAAIKESEESAGRRIAEVQAALFEQKKALAEKEEECLRLQAAIRESEERAKHRVDEIETTLSEREKALAEKEAECGRLEEVIKESEGSAERRIAEMEAALSGQEKALAEKEAECGSLAAAIKECEENAGRRIAEIEKALSEREKALAEKEAECGGLQATIQTARKNCDSQIAEVESRLLEGEKSCASLRVALKAAEESGGRKIAEIEAQLARRIEQISEMQSEKIRLVAALDKEKTQARAEKKRSQERHQNLVAELENRLRIESATLQARANASESQARAARETIASQVGGAVLAALKSPVKALTLPTSLWKIHKDGESRISAKVLREEIATQGPSFKAMLKILQENGLSGLQEHFSLVRLSINSQVLALTALAKECYSVSPQAAIEAGREVYKLDPKTYRAKWLAFRLAEQGLFEEAAQFLAGVADEEFSASERRRAKEILSRASFRSPAVSGANSSGNEKVEESKSVDKPIPASDDKSSGGYSYQNGARQKLTVEELRTRLWSGYSRYALIELRDLADHPDTSESDRQAVLWHMASWFYFTLDYQAALHTLSLSSKSDRHCVLLLVQTLIKLSRAEEALAEVDAAIARFGKKIDFLLIRSTALRLSGIDAGGSLASQEKLQLKQLNSVFIRESLAPLKLKTQKKALSICNIACDLQLGGRESGPKVSIIVPVYNGETTVGIAIESLLQQTHQNVEVIVVDDCSSDRTVEFVRSFAARDSRLKLITKEINEGAYASRNRGLMAATGDYIMVNDSDDWSHPQKIEIQLEKLKENASCVAVMSYWVRVTENLEILGSWRSRRGASSSLLDLNFSSLMFRREILQKLKGWDQVRVGADAEFRSRIEALYGEHAIFLIKNKILSLSLVREDSLTRSKATHVSSTFFGLRWQYRDIYRYRHSLSSKNPGPKGESTLPVPLGNIPNPAAGVSSSFDVIVVSDFALGGKAGKRVVDQLAQLAAAGKKAAILHWRHYELDPGTPLNPAIYELCLRHSIGFITHGDVVTSSLLLYACASILEHVPDSLPQIACEKIVVVEGGRAGPGDFKKEVSAQNFEFLHKREIQWVPESMPVMQLFRMELVDKSTVPAGALAI